eukprot:6195371-Karenia_brevis.AAC.1
MQSADSEPGHHKLLSGNAQSTAKTKASVITFSVCNISTDPAAIAVHTRQRILCVLCPRILSAKRNVNLAMWKATTTARTS